MDIAEPTTPAQPEDVDTDCDQEGCAGRLNRGREYLCGQCASIYDQARGASAEPADATS